MTVEIKLPQTIGVTTTSLEGRIADLEARLRRNQQNYHQTCKDFGEELKIARFRAAEAAGKVEEAESKAKARETEALDLHELLHNIRNEMAVVNPAIEAAQQLRSVLPDPEEVDVFLPGAVIEALYNLYGWLDLLAKCATPASAPAAA